MCLSCFVALFSSPCTVFLFIYTLVFMCFNYNTLSASAVSFFFFLENVQWCETVTINLREFK